MIRLACALSVLAMVSVAAFAVQGIPDFSGDWNLHQYSGNVNGGSGPSAGGSQAVVGVRPSRGGGSALASSGPRRAPAARTITIRQTARELVIEEPESDDAWRIVYKLDRTESVNVNGSVTLRTTSRWEDGRPVTEGTQTVKTGRADVTAAFLETRSVAADGTMVIETTRTVEGRDPTTSRAEYRRQTIR